MAGRTAPHRARAIKPGRQLHLHFHNINPAEVAEIIRRQREDG
jgi:hypothetical protein